MTKQIVNERIDCLSRYSFEGPVKEVRNMLNDLLQELGDEIAIEFQTDCDGYLDIYLYKSRLETDTEYKKRLEREESYKRNIEERERNQYEELKKKYG